MNKTNRSKFLLIEKINTHSYMHKYYIGKVFDCARDAGKWVEFVKEIYYCNFDLIKQACKGKQKTSYGYHWEFVTSKDVI